LRATMPNVTTKAFGRIDVASTAGALGVLV
jgi:L-serine deaminase